MAEGITSVNIKLWQRQLRQDLVERTMHTVDGHAVETEGVRVE